MDARRSNLAVQAARGEEIDSSEIYVPGELVDKSNLDAYLAKYNEQQEIIASYQ